MLNQATGVYFRRRHAGLVLFCLVQQPVQKRLSLVVSTYTCIDSWPEPLPIDFRREVTANAPGLLGSFCHSEALFVVTCHIVLP